MWPCPSESYASWKSWIINIGEGSINRGAFVCRLNDGQISSLTGIATERTIGEKREVVPRDVPPSSFCLLAGGFFIIQFYLY